MKVGFSHGSTMYRMRCSAFAPSISDASTTSEIEPHDRGEVDDRAVARRLPEERHDDDDRPHMRIGVGLDGIRAERFRYAVQQAVIVASGCCRQ